MVKSVELYDKDDLKLMEAATRIATPTKNRIEQIIEYLKEFGHQKIGIVTCIAFSKQSKDLQKILEQEGFEVTNVHCREGELDKSDYTEDKTGSSCNPAYQAKAMEDKDVDFIIVLGLCLGHDLVFQKHNKKPYTNLIVKDFTNKHKTIELFE
jgi:uncharacterized metal-binding protein